ncbi:hypothetical protein LIV57_06790 [Chryseobacterium sp. X308]|uniref:hypothetical protein n=1 Tax=Chryseobacterium sp. X308 TaxID=2884873 RepID=UPI001D132A9A|nr:hypothetical protein [Chryseobacterium sp. X308]MCC3214974.1 hypothetical protein [Chryseobacterium sp. X308]
MKLKKNECKNIAKVLIAYQGISLDQFAFEDCYDMIDDKDVDNILNEIREECKKSIARIADKLGVDIDYRSTESVIETMYFES